MKDFNINKVGGDVNVDQSENNAAAQEDFTIAELLMMLFKKIKNKWL